MPSSVVAGRRCYHQTPGVPVLRPPVHKYRFSVVGHDTGMVLGYALTADHRDRVDRLVVAETLLPGISDSPPLFAPAAANDVLWHIGFNRIEKLNEQLVRGREGPFFEFEFSHRTVQPLPRYAIDFYVKGFAASRAALRGSFEFYRATDVTTAQNMARMEPKLTQPVLAIGGQLSQGPGVAATMERAAVSVQGLVVPGVKHFLAEEAPEAMVAALSTFLAA